MLDTVHHFFVVFFFWAYSADRRCRIYVSIWEFQHHLFLEVVWCTWVSAHCPRSRNGLPGRWGPFQFRPHGGSQWDLDGDAAKCRCTASVWPLARSLALTHSHGELGSSAAAVGQQQQAPQTQPREWIAPQQRGRTSEHRLHAVPPQATLPRGLLVFEAFDFLRGIGMAPSTESFKQKYVWKTKQSNTERFCPPILN